MAEAKRVTCVAMVDDDESLCRSLARLLRVSGVHSVTYLSAEDFLRDENRPPFDCLILDIQLGGMSGIQLHEQLAKGGSTTPVVFLTAHDEPELRERAQQTGCSAFLGKHDPGEAVLAAVARAIRAKRAGSN